MFMVDHPEVLVVHSSGMTPAKQGGDSSVFCLKRLFICIPLRDSPKEFDDRVPQWLEVNKQLCNEVTKRHLKEKQDVIKASS